MVINTNTHMHTAYKYKTTHGERGKECVYDFLYLYIVFFKGKDVRTNRSELINTYLVNR